MNFTMNVEHVCLSFAKVYILPYTNYIIKHMFLSLARGVVGKAVGCESIDRAAGSNLAAATGAMLKDTNFFLLIEDYGYSKSRTKIGVSVDTKV